MTTQDHEVKAMELIKTSGVLNPSMTMDKILELTQKLAAMEPTADAALGGSAAPKHVDTFIHSHFIFRHED